MTAAADFLAPLLERIGTAPSPTDVVDGLVPEIADLAQIFARCGDEIHLVAYRHIDPGHHPVLAELAAIHRPHVTHPTDPIAQVLRTGEARLQTWVRRSDVERATADRRVHAIFDAIQPRNIVIAPLARDGIYIGALLVAMSSSSRRFIDGDLEFMRRFAERLSPILAMPAAC